jgi:small subunit ribosomal protein S21e
MQNDQKQYVDLYVPRRCYATNKLLDSKDNASVQISLFNSDLNRGDKGSLTLVLSGFVRAKGNSDAALNRYLKQQGILSFE